MEDVFGHVYSGMNGCHQPSTGQAPTACLAHQEEEPCWAEMRVIGGGNIWASSHTSAVLQLEGKG